MTSWLSFIRGVKFEQRVRHAAVHVEQGQRLDLVQSAWRSCLYQAAHHGQAIEEFCNSVGELRAVFRACQFNSANYRGRMRLVVDQALSAHAGRSGAAAKITSRSAYCRRRSQRAAGEQDEQGIALLALLDDALTTSETVADSPSRRSKSPARPSAAKTGTRRMSSLV